MNEKARQHGRNRAKIFLFFSLVLIVLSVYVFKRTPAAEHKDVCALFSAQPSWYRDAQRASQKWGGFNTDANGYYASGVTLSGRC